MPFRLLLGLLIVMWITLGAIFMTAESPGSHGMPREGFQAMLEGGPPATARIALLGWAFGSLQIAIFITCITIGITPRRKVDENVDRSTTSRGLLYALFTAGSLAFVTAFTLMVWADRAAVVTGHVTYLGPFPAATTWMLFGVWAAPLLFVAAYIIGFSRWIIPDPDLARFEALVAQTRQSVGGERP